MTVPKTGKQGRVELRGNDAGGSGGFSLVEMLCVIAILALAATFALPGRLSPSDRVQVDVAIHRIASIMQFAAARALGAGCDIVVVVDVPNHTVVTPDQPALPLDPAMIVTVTGSKTELLGDGRIGVRFFPDGAATGAQIVVSRGSASEKLSVNWFTATASRADKNGY